MSHSLGIFIQMIHLKTWFNSGPNKFTQSVIQMIHSKLRIHLESKQVTGFIRVSINQLFNQFVQNH